MASRYLPAVLFASLSLMTTQASASCAQRDLFGRWSTYTSGYNGAANYWVKCTVRINALGGINSAGCVDSSGNKTAATGSFTLKEPSYCVWEGKITYTTNNSVARIKDLTLSTEKDTASGVGIFDGPFSIFMIKIE